MSIKICIVCGKEILGEYEKVETKRKSIIYICKKCAKGDKKG